MKRKSRFLEEVLRFLAFACFLIAGTASNAYAQHNCPGAIPNDPVRDDEQIENCLNAGGPREVRLDGGYYWVGATIEMRVSDVTFASAGTGSVLLMATDDLYGPMLEVLPGTNGYQITNLQFWGRVYSRTFRNLCVAGPGAPHRKFGNNLFLTGSNFTVVSIESTGAMCGSSLEVDGSNFTLASNFIGGNGIPEDEPGPSGKYADGITLLRCDNGWVWNNTAVDNTDIGIVVGGGNGCYIEGNSLLNQYKHAFAGLHVGSFQNGGRDHPNSHYRWNVTDSWYDKQAFGVAVGFHPWGNEPTYFAGYIYENESYGAVVNLAVDGIDSGYIQRNIWGAYQGTFGYGCNVVPTYYTAGHFGPAADIQGGYLSNIYDCF